MPNPAGRLKAISFAALAAACLAAAEVFRVVFVDYVGTSGRRHRQPGSIDLVSADKDIVAPIVDIAGIVVPDLHLVGAGAIGQASALALATSGTRGRLTVVDPQVVELSNLQRYVLSSEQDVGRSKTAVVERAFAQTQWTVTSVESEWGRHSEAGPRRANVLVALDSVRDRLGVAAGLHDRVYNAYTQPADLGWSRHEDFGEEPCLACLYYPNRSRPSDDELIAGALKQSRLRVLSYFVSRTPVGFPLPVVASAADLPPPQEAGSWLQRSILEDLVASGLVAADQASSWTGRTIGQLYSEGVCGGGILQFGERLQGDDVIVPLAHQSAFAGVMLALQPVLAAIPDLAAMRPKCIESRINLMAGLPQLLPRPRVRTPGCLCSDADYLDAVSTDRSK